MQGKIFSIEEFSVYDGPGIRTTVFLKGCPLRCTWCHNPEGQSPESEIVRSPNGCLHCGACERAAQYENGMLSYTQASIDACPNRLLRISGDVYESEQLCKRLLKNASMLDGVTFSGGEPLMQSEFVLECIAKLKGKLHTAVQTSGFCSPSSFQKILGTVDYVLYDLKLIDPKRHLEYTGVSNQNILKNFRALAASNIPFTVRIPLIPTVTDIEENLGAIAALLQSLGISYAELLPYNAMAGGKYKMLGRSYTPRFDESVKPQPRPEIFQAHSIQTEIL